jgi:hypothetical protein
LIAGWAHLRAAGVGTAHLNLLNLVAAAALLLLLLLLQVSLDGGALDLGTAGPFNAAAGRPLLRQQLLAALSSGTSSNMAAQAPGTPTAAAAAAAGLSAGLQRLLLLAQAAGELQNPSAASVAGSSISSRTAGAVQVLVQVRPATW